MRTQKQGLRRMVFLSFGLILAVFLLVVGNPAGYSTGAQPLTPPKADVQLRTEPAPAGAPDGVAKSPASTSSLNFQVDDGTREHMVISGDDGASIWLNRFTPQAGSFPFTIRSISVMWPNGGLVGKSVRLLVYGETGGVGYPTNATLLGQALVSISKQDQFESYAVNINVPGPGDIYIGYEDLWTAGGTTSWYVLSVDSTAPQERSWWVTDLESLSVDYVTLSNNDSIETAAGANIDSNFMIRASDQNGNTVPSATTTKTPTARPTATRTLTPRRTATKTLTPRPTATKTLTPRPTTTRTLTPRRTATKTLTPRPTATRTLTARPTVTKTPTGPTVTRTLTLKPTATRSRTALASVTRTRTKTTVPAGTVSATRTFTKTATRTATKTATRTFTKTATKTATRTRTKTATRTRTPTATPTAGSGPGSLTWVQPVANQETYHVSRGTVHLQVAASASGGVAHVDFQRWDAVHEVWVAIGADTTAPYEANVNVADLNPDWNNVYAIVSFNQQDTIYDYIWIIKENDTPTPTRTRTVTNTPTGTRTPETLTAAYRAMTRLNQYRALAGLPLLQLHPSIVAATQAHASYYLLNHNDAAAMTFGPHGEVAGKPGFTGKWASDRITVAGFPYWGGAEIMHFINDPISSVDGWMATIYHRVIGLDSGARYTGYGSGQRVETVNGSTHVESVDVMDFGAGAPSDPPYPTTPFPLAYPVHGQTGVPTTWGGGESPDPLPPGAARPVGYPFTLQGAGGTLRVDFAELHDGGGQSIAVHPNPSDCSTFNCYAIIPVQPLQPTRVYIVHARGAVGAVAFDRNWQFTTGVTSNRVDGAAPPLLTVWQPQR